MVTVLCFAKLGKMAILELSQAYTKEDKNAFYVSIGFHFIYCQIISPV